MKLFLFTLFLATTGIAGAQISQIDVQGGAVGGYGSVKVSDPSSLGKRPGSKIDYSEVRGHCFWNDDWKPVILILKGGKHASLEKAKLNLHTNEVHYLEDGVELVAMPGLVKKVLIFSEADTAAVPAVFESIKDPQSNTTSFYQLLNEGKIELANRTSVSLLKKTYDPSVGKDEYRFIWHADLFVKQADGLTPLKKINKSALVEIVKTDTNDERWLTDTGNKLKSESDVVSFFTYLNSK